MIIEIGQEGVFETSKGMLNDVFDIVLDGKQGHEMELLEGNAPLPIEECSTTHG